MGRPSPALAVILLVGYAAVVVWLTWPLATHLTTHLPAPRPEAIPDTLFTAWVLGYESHALATAPLRLAEANIYHPAPHALFYGPTDLSALPYFMPPFLVTGNPALALGLVFLGGVVLTAWALHLTLFRWTASHPAGFVAAWTLLMTRWTLWTWVPTVPAYAILLYFPSILLLAGAATLRTRRVLWLAALVVLQGLTDAYMAVALLVPLALLATGRLIRHRTRAAGRRLLVAIVLAAAVLLAANASYLLVRAENPELRQQTVWTHHPAPIALPWDLLGDLAPTAVPMAVLPVIVAGAFAARYTARPRGLWAQGILWTTAGVLMSITPLATWNGRPIVLPHVVIAPVYQVLRIPSRLGVAALIGLCTLAGAAVAECLRCPLWSRLPHRPALVARAGLVALLAFAMYEDYANAIGRPAAVHRMRLPARYPLAAAISSDAPFLQQLRESGGPLLELPVGPAGFAPLLNAQAMYRSLFHWRPLLNGYSSYWPARFPARMALAERLPDPSALAALRNETGLELILVHTEALGAEGRASWLRRAGGGGGLRLVGWEGGEMLFRVE